MNQLSLVELKSGIEDLVSQRVEALRRLPNGAWFEAQLRRLHGEIAGLPAGGDTASLAERLQALDETHDAWGRAIHHVTSAVEESPASDSRALRAAAIVRARYMASVVETRSAYAVEAERARQRRTTLGGDEGALKVIATPDGATLDAWIDRYVAAGEALADALGGAEGDAGQSPSRSSQALRSEALALLGDLRSATKLALRADASLPRGLEEDILGGVEQMQRVATQRDKTGVGIPAMPD